MVVPIAPVAAALALYAVPTLAAGNDVGKVRVGPVTTKVCADEVAVSAVAVPESLIENLTVAPTFTQAADGTPPTLLAPVDVSAPVAAFRLRQEGRVPEATAQFLYGGMPPVPASVTE